MQPCLFCGGDSRDPDHASRCDGRQGSVEAGAPDLAGLVHRDDPATSRAAAARIAHHRTDLHTRVLAALVTHGPMTDAELEHLPEFAGYGPSTIRKRRSELFQAGALTVVGERRNDRQCRMLVWAPRTPPRRA